jgi:tetratricopeptide (TPR) repeat protein
VFGAELGRISGVVRDADGKSIEAVRITLKSEDSPSDVLQVSTGKSGEYAFSGLHVGEYRILAELDGYQLIPARVVKILSESLTVQLDFELLRSGAEKDSSQSNNGQQPPKFAAAGVRGLIDAGGYSAPANAAAASGLVKGIADIKRTETDNHASSEKEWPCGLEQELKKALEAHPDSADINRRLGQFYLAHDQAVRAIPYLEVAREKQPTDFATSKALARAWIRNSQFESARNLLTTLTTNQRDPELHGLLARAFEGSGMFRQASEQYQLAAKDQPTTGNLLGVGYELILDGSPDDAARAFESGLQIHPESIELLIGAGTAKFLQHGISEGNLYFLRASNLDPSDPRPYAFLASASKLQGPESGQVLDSLQRFLELAPDNPDACYYYAVCLWNRRGDGTTSTDLDKIEALLGRAIQLNPGFGKAHFQLGALYFERENYSAAVREYETTLRIAPDNNEAHYRLASAYKRTGQTALAAQEVRIFEENKRKQTVVEANGISIEQFVSVIGPTGKQAVAEVPCTGTAE